MKVKILGAGSIGNHLANAARTLGWLVDIVDVDPAALDRMRSQIYPGRYGAWDEAIRLFASNAAPTGDYDLICIGTPPDMHVALARSAIAERPKAVLIEKPLCGPDLVGVRELAEEADANDVACFVGYDHVVGEAARRAAEFLFARKLGRVQTLDVEFREEWGGIFAAHPWLSGPADSYLGYWRRGGGASGEHSHALNLWQYFAHCCGAGRVIEVQAMLDIVNDGAVDYDRLSLISLKTERGLVGRCVQDVVTRPPRKWARVQGEEGHLEWWAGRELGVDVVTGAAGSEPSFEYKISKARPQDFIEELRHIVVALTGDPKNSPISLVRGLETMLTIAAVHTSHATGRRVRIDYDHGWTVEALTI